MTTPVVGSVIIAALSILANQPSLLPFTTPLAFQPTTTSSPPFLRMVSTLTYLKDPTSCSRNPDPTVDHLVQVVRELLANGNNEEVEKRVRAAAPPRLRLSGMG